MDQTRWRQNLSEAQKYFRASVPEVHRHQLAEVEGEIVFADSMIEELVIVGHFPVPRYAELLNGFRKIQFKYLMKLQTCDGDNF